jgi:hypothetical protein
MRFVCYDLCHGGHRCDCVPDYSFQMPNLMLLLQMRVQRRVVRIQQCLTQQINGRTNVVAGGESVEGVSVYG